MSANKQNLSGITSALSEAESILLGAENRAAEIRAQAERAYEEAKASGFQQGYAEGKHEALATALRLISDQTKIADKLSEQAARLALAIAGSVIGEQARVDANVVKNIAAHALRQSVLGEQITLCTHPEDLESLRAELPQFRQLSGGTEIKLLADSSIERGGCVVRTEFGEVDANISTLIESVSTKLGLGRR